jgi:hypothetical protein
MPPAATCGALSPALVHSYNGNSAGEPASHTDYDAAPPYNHQMSGFLKEFFSGAYSPPRFTGP